MKKLITKTFFHFPGNVPLAFLLFFSVVSASGQTVWTHQHVDPYEHLYDVAYGAGKYVQVGDAGLIRTSTDRSVWEKQQSGLNKNYYLSAIIYANGKFVTVGAGGTILTSPDGYTWTKQNSGTGKTLKGIAYGNGVFVIVGAFGTILTSTDGFNWTGRSSGTAEQLNDVTYGSTYFVAVGENGEIRTSLFHDLVNWTKRVSGTTNTLHAVTPGKWTSFAAVGAMGAIVYSNDALNWKVMSGPANSGYIRWTGIASNPATGSFVAVNDGDKVLTSANGSFWGNPMGNSGAPWIMFRMRFLQNHFLGTGRNMIIRASYNDGKTWSSPTPNFSMMNMNGAAFGNGRFVAVGNEPLGNGSSNSGISNLIVNSTDGVNFKASETIHLVGGAKSFNDVTFGKGMFVAVGDDAIIQTSVDGIKWDYSQVTLGKKLTGVAFGNGRFVAVGYEGLILWSLDGKVWYKANSAGTVYYNGVSFVNNQFVLVGRDGVLATSTMGANWEFKYTGTKNELRSVAYGGGRWVAVGVNNTIVSSTNGYGWKSQHFSPTNVHFNDICYANGQFVIVTVAGTFYTSTSTNFWTKVPDYFSYASVNSITHGNGQFFAVGTSAILITSPDAEGPFLSDPPMKCSNCRTSETEVTVDSESENKVDFQVTTYPNPVDDQFSLHVKGATGEKVRLILMDVSGRTILDKLVNPGADGYQESIPMTQKQTGMYLLRVSTPTQTQTVKVLKR